MVINLTRQEVIRRIITGAKVIELAESWPAAFRQLELLALVGAEVPLTPSELYTYNEQTGQRVLT